VAATIRPSGAGRCHLHVTSSVLSPAAIEMLIDVAGLGLAPSALAAPARARLPRGALGRSDHQQGADRNDERELGCGRAHDEGRH